MSLCPGRVAAIDASMNLNERDGIAKLAPPSFGINEREVKSPISLLVNPVPNLISTVSEPKSPLKNQSAQPPARKTKPPTERSAAHLHKRDARPLISRLAGAKPIVEKTPPAR